MLILYILCLYLYRILKYPIILYRHAVKPLIEIQSPIFQRGEQRSWILIPGIGL